MRLAAQLQRRLLTPTDPAGLAAFRIMLGVLVATSSMRFLASDWPQKLFGAPRFFFRYAGFSFVPVPDVGEVRATYVVLVFLGAALALGFMTRLAAFCFVVLFAWIELADVTNYLNHHWLLFLLVLLLVFLPGHAVWSVDAWLWGNRSPTNTATTVPFAAVFLLRFQVACVYVFAAVAKLGPDWLLFGQPLGVWLPARSSLPVMGPLLSSPLWALVFSWCGFLYDATIVLWLSWRITRPFAYVAVLVFHSLTLAFFDIGIFPFLMSIATTMFFAPAWPRRGVEALVRFVRRLPMAVPPGSHQGLLQRERFVSFFRLRTALSSVVTPNLTVGFVVLWCSVHTALPLRAFVFGDDVLWDETGMRFSWRVMVREKSGSLSYRVVFADARLPQEAPRRTVFVSPHEWLTFRQVNEMTGQPDLILQLAHAIHDDFVARGHRDVEVFADARITLNARPPTPFIDERINLAAVKDCFACRPSFVLHPPSAPPPSPFRDQASSFFLFAPSPESSALQAMP
jgi:vitamin K-dependent gamma-carboxylase